MRTTTGKILLTVIMAFGWMLAFVKPANAQCDWSVQATADSSRCAISGKITASLTGPDKDNVTNLLYRLKLVGGIEYPEVSTPVFQNLAEGIYELTAKGICNGQLDSSTIQVIVPGNYVGFTANGAKLRDAFPNCNSGQAKMLFFNGRKRYRVSITAAPAAYTGNSTFYTETSELIIDSLNAGNYTFVLSDSCGAASSEQFVTIGELPTPTLNNTGLVNMNILNPDCSTLNMPAPPIGLSSPFVDYRAPGSGFTFGVALPGNAPAVYKDVYGANSILLSLPAGQTMKDIYGQTINYYLKDPCGEITVLPYVIPVRTLWFSVVKNCNIDFGITAYAMNTVCLPVIIKAKNRSSQQEYSDTAYDYNKWDLHGLPYGSYDITYTAGDGAILRTATDFNVIADNAATKYTTELYPFYGRNGIDGAVQFDIRIQSGQVFSANTVIELVAPATHSLKRTVSSDGGNAFGYIMSDNRKMFTPGTYTWKITDQCGIYYVTREVKETDVYRFEIDAEEKDTCNGRIVKPTGTARFNGETLPVYFKIVAGPPGQIWNQAIVPEGASLLLPGPGDYRVAVTANSSYVEDYFQFYGLTANVKFIHYDPKPLAIDPNLTAGFICPQGAPNSGSIVIRAINGILPEGGNYQYKLAAAGNGFTGPYLDSNYTGRFNSGPSYSLMVHENYDIKVIDGCGASVVQTVQILDYATAQLALLDKEVYCVGDIARLNVLQLPTTAIQYRWTFPDGTIDTSKAVTIRNLGPSHRGVYQVAISADICQDTIRSQVTLDLAEFEQICYSAVTDTSVNPYTAGLLGNWRPFRTFAYYGARNESDPGQQTNTRKDGTYQDFLSFWQKQQNGWKASKDTTRWVWTTESTLFNKKGFELENKNALGIYNAAIYGFENALPVAVVQNSRYREAAVEGFEDYDFSSNTCETGCITGRRFDFSGYMHLIDSTQRHSGRYSVRVMAGDTMFTSHTISDTAGAASLPVFVTGASQCTAPGLVLKAIKADSSVLLPGFSPLTGKKMLFSAWVKEQADCNCTAYTSNVVKLVIKKGEETFIHTITPSGNIIEGWQRYEYVADVPAGSTQLSLLFIASGASDIYVDDIRLHPYNANMKSYAYDPMTMRMMAELDQNNYATFFEYDDDGVLIRVKKETERGIKTIKETRSALVKE